MSASNFSIALNDFTKQFEGLNEFIRAYHLEDFKWKPLTTQYASETTYEAHVAEHIAKMIARTLGLKFGNQEIGTHTSRSGGDRVIIWNIPRFEQALNSYQNKIHPSFEHMKTSAIDLANKTKEFKEAEKLLNLLCERNWDENFCRAGKILEQKFPLSAWCEVQIQPVAKEESYLLSVIPSYQTQKKEMRITHEDIKYILKILKEHDIFILPAEIIKAEELFNKRLSGGGLHIDSLTASQILHEKFGIDQDYVIQIKPSEKDGNYRLIAHARPQGWPNKEISLTHADILFISQTIRNCLKT